MHPRLASYAYPAVARSWLGSSSGGDRGGAGSKYRVMGGFFGAVASNSRHLQTMGKAP